MPIPVPDLTRMQSRPQWQKWYLAVDKPATVWTAQVDGDHTRGATSITVKNGATVDANFSHGYTPGGFGFTDLWWHLTLWVGTTAGAQDVGIVLFHKITGTTPITVTSNDLTLSNNYYLTLKWEIRPSAVLPSIDGVYEDEEKIYVDQNTDMKPLARIGPPAAGFLNDAGNFDVDFYSDSESPIAAALAEHRWQFRNGAPTTGAIANPGTVRYTVAGTHWVRYMVRDANDKFNMRLSRTYVYDDSNPPVTDFEIAGFIGDRDSGGWRATVTIHGDADESDFADLAEVAIFTEAYWDGTQNDVGYMYSTAGTRTHRDNIMFVGYIVADSVHKEPFTGYVTFEIASALEIAKDITCWGASLKAEASPTKWHEIPAMTLNLAAFHVFTEHSTFDHIQDIYLWLYKDPYAGTPTDIPMSFIDIGEGPLYDHLKAQIGQAGRAILINSKYAQVFLSPDAQLSLTANRPTDVLFTLAHDDWRDGIALADEPATTECCQVDFIGFYYDGDDDPIPLGALAPGRQWPTGAVQKVTGVRVDTQTEANQYSGIFERNFNAEFRNVHLPMAGFWPVFDIAPQRYVAVTLLATDTKRGLVWTTVNHIPKSVTFQLRTEGGYCLTDLTCAQEIGDRVGVTNLIPTEDPSPSPPPAPSPAPPPSPPLGVGVLVWSEDQIGRSLDFFDVTTPSWLSVKGAITGTIYAVDVGTDRKAYATSSDGVWYCSDITDDAPSWACIKTLAAARTETGHAASDFRSIKVASGGTIFLGWHEWNYSQRGYWTGDHGGINYIAFAQYGACLTRVVTSRCTHACYLVGGSAPWFGIGSGGCGGALVWQNPTYQVVDPPAPGGGQICPHVNEGFAIDWNGWIWTEASNYTTKYDAVLQAAGRFGMDVLDGTPLYSDFGTPSKWLYRGTTLIATADTYFGAGNRGGRAIYAREDSDEIIWVPRSQITEASGDLVVVWTDDAFLTFVDKTGDWFAQCGDPWQGGSGASSDDGNCCPLVFTY